MSRFLHVVNLFQIAKREFSVMGYFFNTINLKLFKLKIIKKCFSYVVHFSVCFFLFIFCVIYVILLHHFLR